MKKMLLGAVAAGAVALALAGVGAPQAHADAEQGYLDELAQNGVPMGRGPGGALRGGREVCDDLHHGMSPEQIIGTQMGVFGGVWGPAIVAAAQRHLCPDTLR
jgi:hypothetical protein